MEAAAAAAAAERSRGAERALHNPALPSTQTEASGDGRRARDRFKRRGLLSAGGHGEAAAPARSIDPPP